MSFIEDAIYYIQKKYIICWGLGRYFQHTMVPFFKEYGIEQNVKYIVDKDLSKPLPELKALKNAKRIRVEELEEVIDDNMILIYTAKDCREMELYVNTNSILKEAITIPGYVLGGLFLDEKVLKDDLGVYSAINTSNDGIRIPKIINTFWFSNDSIPEKYKECMKSWEKFCPDYEVRVWSLNDYNSGGCRFFDEAISVKNWAHASDFSRIDVISKYGGIYMDMDVEVVKPLDNLLKNEAYIGFESMQRIDCGSGFGTIKDNKIFAEIRNEYLDKPFILPDGTYNTKEICSVVYTKLFERYGLELNGKYQKIKNITVYPFEYLSAKSFETGIIYKTNNTYSIHHHGGTWLSNDNKEVIKKRYADVNYWIKTFNEKGNDY